MDLRAIKKDRKGGVLDKSQGFMIGLLGLSILGVLIIIVLGSLGGVSQAQTTHTVTNKTSAWLNSTGYQLTPLTTANPGALSGSYKLTKIWAKQGGVYNVSVPLANATVSSSGLVTNATSVTQSDVSYSYTYNTYLSTITNVTNAVPTFFSNATTWLTLLSILVIVAIVLMVLRFFGFSGASNESSL